MISVVCRWCSVQLLTMSICVLALVVLAGCGPETTKKPVTKEKPSAQQKAPSEQKQKAPAAQQQPAADKPADKDADEPADKDAPGVDGPVQEMPAEPAEQAPAADKPADKPAEKTSAVELPISQHVAADASKADFKPYTEAISGTDAKFDLVPIAGGEYTMGSPSGEADRKDDEGPQVKVKIEPFWMGKCEVTWNEYELWGLGLDQQRRKMKNQQATEVDTLADAVGRPTKPYSDMTFGMGKEGYPAICMTQLSAKMYCKWLSAKTGHYYRLPTEAEWEYACRAGTTSVYSFGDDASQLDEYAWHTGNSDEKYHKIGLKKPNPWGLYDMHGNVCEWTADEYDPKFYATHKGTVDRPLKIASKAYPHAVRGGAWTDEASMLRSAARRGSSKDWKQQDPQIPQSIWYLTDADFVGFRVVRPLQDPTPEEAAKYDLDEFQKTDLIDYKKAQAGKE